MGDRQQHHHRGGGGRGGGGGGYHHRGGGGRGGGGYRGADPTAFEPENPADKKRMEETIARMAAIPDTDKNLFSDYQKELDDKHDRHERIVKISRDITIESKRIIFLLHRITTASKDEDKEKILAEAEHRLHVVRQNQFFMVAKELAGLDQHQFNRAITAGIQEYIEACSFCVYLRQRRLVTWQEIQAALFFGPAPPTPTTPPVASDQQQKPEKEVAEEEQGDMMEVVQEDNNVGNDNKDQEQPEQHQLWVQVSLVDYLCGVGDLAGELMRYAMNSISAGALPVPAEVAAFLQHFYRGCVFLGSNGVRDFSGKVRVLLQSLQKVESALYTLNVRRSEVPDHMLADFISSQISHYMGGNEGGGHNAGQDDEGGGGGAMAGSEY